MVALRDAITTAKQFVLGAYSDDPPKDLRLEEIRRNENDDWLVTIGFRAFSEPPPLPREEPEWMRLPRDYKVVLINGRTGEPVSIKNRND